MSDQRSSNSAVYEVQEGMDRDLNKQFRVTDTRTDSRVATCYVQSNADLVCAALNAYTADEPPAVDVAPIAKLTVRDGLVQRAGLYAPGLPDGDHDVFPVGRAHEPPAGVKCTHCNGKGYNEPIYDEQDGWIDETPCETCNGSGRITTVEQYLKTLPANWHEDSSLETWFPITAEELKRLKDERASQPPDDLLADLREIEGELMCFGGVGHHCSRCDNSTYDLSQKVRRLIDRLSPVETAPEGRGVRDNPPPHALGSSEGADTHSRLSEPDAANVAKPHDDPTAHRVADLRAQSQPTNEPSDDLAFPLDARVREVFGQTEGTIVAIDSRYEVECTDGKHRFYWHRQLERVAETKDAGECGACDKPGEHCANVHGICSRHGGRAHETSAPRVGDPCPACTHARLSSRGGYIRCNNCGWHGPKDAP